MRKLFSIFTISMILFIFKSFGQTPKPNIDTSGVNKTVSTLIENTVIERHLQNNYIKNDFIISPNGSFYLKLNNNTFFQLYNELGDSWGRITEDKLRISIDPNNPQIFYAISSSFEILKSMDGAKNWIRIQNGLPNGIKSWSIIINPHNSSEVFLLTTLGIYKTSDAGFTWQPFKLGESQSQFLVNSTKKNIYYLLNGDGLNISNDSGLSWKIISNSLPKIMVKSVGRTSINKTIKIQSFINVNYPKSSFILVFTENGIYKTINDGVNWTELNDGIPKSATFTTVFLSDNEIFIGGYDYDIITKKTNPLLYKSDIYATKWNKIKIDSKNMLGISGIYKDNSHPGIFIKSYSDMISYIDTAMNVIALNYGITPHSKISAFSIVKNGNKYTQYAIVDNENYTDIVKHGIWCSKNNGVSWDYALPDNLNPKWTDSKVCRIVQSPINPLEIFIFDNEHKYITYDGGLNWNDFNKIYDLRDVTDFQFDPQNQNILYFTLGVNDYETNLYRIDKANWGYTKLCQSGFYFVIANDDNKKILTSNGKLSLDGGWTWNQVVDYDKVGEAVEWDYNKGMVLPLSINKNVITLAAWGRNVNNLFFISSDDLGISWKWKSKKIVQLDDHRYNFFDTRIFTINEKNPSNIIALDKKENDDNSFEYIVNQSKDNARSWKPIFNLSAKNISYYGKKGGSSGDLSVDLSIINSIYIADIDGNNVIYLTFSTGGMIFSKDDGKTWVKIGGIHENN